MKRFPCSEARAKSTQNRPFDPFVLRGSPRPLRPLRLIFSSFLPLALLAIALPRHGRLAADPVVVVVKAPRFHIGDGRVLENGVAILADGRIREIGSGLPVPEGDEVSVIEVAAGSVTPGLIDANARLEPKTLARSTRQTAAQWVRAVFDRYRRDAHENPHDHPDPSDFAPGVVTEATAEQSSEVVPHTRVLDSLDLGSPDFERLARGGVTTVYASPDSSAVIGPRGAILKTAGRAGGRVVLAEAAVKAVMGSDPTDVGTSNRSARGLRVNLYTRRPTTRMGVTWVFRKAFYDTMARAQGLPVEGADTPSEAASTALAQVMAGKIPLRVQARTLADITTAYRLCAEFQLPFLLEEASEAHRCLDLLKSRPSPVIYGPIEDRPSGLRRSTYETRGARLYTLRSLIEAGVPVALSAQDLREEDGLARQAMYAMRFGVEPAAALEAVTSTPARLLGVVDRIGTLEAGKDADLVVWSGEPFTATSMPLVVLLGGEVVVDRRE